MRRPATRWTIKAFADAVSVSLLSGTKSRRPVLSDQGISLPTVAHLLVASELALILPALLFLVAVGIRHVPSVAAPAQAIVMWYAIRPWTLWVLLIALPFAAVITGGATLLGNVTTTEWAAPPFPVGVAPKRLIANETCAAGMILTVVILHMLGN